MANTLALGASEATLAGSSPASSTKWGYGGTGIRNGFKPRWIFIHEGSIPSIPTNKKEITMRTEELTIVNFEWVISSDRNDVIFITRENFEEEYL